MTSATDIIIDAYQRLGVYAPGETMSAADASTGLSVLNDMIDNWSAENLPIYTLSSISFTTSSAVGAYTIGLSGTINNARPSYIQGGPAAASYTHSGSTTPISVVSAVEWRNIESTGTGTGSTGISNTMWYDPQYPLGVINVMPVPTSNSDTITFEGWVACNSLPNLSLEQVYEAGADLALKTNLAIQLKPYFLDSQLPPELVALAWESKNALRYTNITSRAMMRRHQPGREPVRAAGGS